MKVCHDWTIGLRFALAAYNAFGPYGSQGFSEPDKQRIRLIKGSEITNTLMPMFVVNTFKEQSNSRMIAV